MTDATISQVAQQITETLAVWNQNLSRQSDWLGGTASGGPNGDGRYPLLNARGVESLVMSPARMADFVSGPAGLAQLAKTVAELARDEAVSAADRADAQRALAEAARGAAVDARNLSQTNRSFAATSEANARYWAELAEGHGADTAADHEAVQQLHDEAVAASTAAGISATQAATSATLAATFNPALFDKKSDTLSADRLTGVLNIDRIPILPSMRQFASSGTLANLTTQQQTDIGQGSIVTTTDGFRYVYSGTGSKTLAASYVVLADTTPEWTSISGKPTTFAPSAHSHVWADITNPPATYAPSAHTQDWTTITGKPTTFTPSAHTHVIGDVTNLQTTLDAKAPLAAPVFTGNVSLPAVTVFRKEVAGTSEGGQLTLQKPDTNGLASDTIVDVNGASIRFFEGGGNFRGAYLPLDLMTNGVAARIWTSADFTAASFAASGHTHDWSVITGKPTTFAPSAHTHAISEITNLQTTLNDKVSLSITTGQTLASALYVTNRLNINGADPYLGSDNPSKSMVVAGGGGWSNTGSCFVAYGISHPSQSGNILIQAADSGIRAFTVAGFQTVNFNVRPTWAGTTPWDSGNFNPATKADASSWNSATTQANISATKGFYSGVNSSSTIANQSGAAALEARSQDASAGAAFLQFHRPGVYATNFGIDNDSKLKIGGWSYGATSDHIWHNGNIPTNKDQYSLDLKKRFYFAHDGRTYFNSPDGFAFRGASDQTLGYFDGSGNFLAQNGLYTEGNGVHIRGGSPTIYFRDTDHRTAMIHVNSNTFHILRGSGTDTEAWETVNGRWPLTINLDTNEASFGGNVRADGGSIYSGSEVYTTNWFRVQGGSSGLYWEQYGGGWLMSDSTYLRVYNNKYLYSAGAAGFDGNVNMGSFAVLSDARLKSDIRPLTGHGELIDRLAVKTYIKGGKPEWGVIAQEVELIEPMLVVRAGDPNGEWGDEPLRTVDSNSLMFAILAEVKDLRVRVAGLEGRQ